MQPESMIGRVLPSMPSATAECRVCSPSRPRHGAADVRAEPPQEASCVRFTDLGETKRHQLRTPPCFLTFKGAVVSFCRSRQHDFSLILLA